MRRHVNDVRADIKNLLRRCAEVRRDTVDGDAEQLLVAREVQLAAVGRPRRRVAVDLPTVTVHRREGHDIDCLALRASIRQEPAIRGDPRYVPASLDDEPALPGRDVGDADSVAGSRKFGVEDLCAVGGDRPGVLTRAADLRFDDLIGKSRWRAPSVVWLLEEPADA